MMHVLFMNMNVLGDLSFIQVGKFGAVGRAHFIDGTKIGFTIEELTGRAYIHPLAFPVLIQPFFLELADGHVEKFGNSLKVLEGIRWRHRSATVGTNQAVHFLPYFCFCFAGNCFQIFVGIVFSLGEKTSESGSVLQYLSRKLPSVVRHIGVKAEGKRILKGKMPNTIFV
jgi:hypothetical protein